MFERYTEKARRVMFFSRYEASQYGSPYIGTEHLLLGLLREDRALVDRFLRKDRVWPEIRGEIERRITPGKRISTTVEIPLSDECKTALDFAVETSERFGHRFVGTEHLLVGILRVEKSLAAQILMARGLEAGPIQEQMEDLRYLRDWNSTAERKKHTTVFDRTRTRTRAISGASLTLDSFLAGLSRLKSEDLINFFAQNAECIDASGKRWNREEIVRGFDTLFAHYAKKNASYLVEATLVETSDLFVATVLWKNALLASEERVWMHRMSVVLMAEEDGWKALLLQVTGVQPPSSITK